MPTLDDLRDLHLPPEPGLWPLPPGLWAVAAALVVLAAILARRHVRRRPLRAALRELDALADEWRRETDAPRLARGLSQLVRRYALVRFPEHGAAGLTGAAWLGFLDDHGGGGEFRDGPGELLASLPYRSGAGGDPACEPLIALVRRWLKANAP